MKQRRRGMGSGFHMLSRYGGPLTLPPLRPLGIREIFTFTTRTFLKTKKRDTGVCSQTEREREREKERERDYTSDRSHDDVVREKYGTIIFTRMFSQTFHGQKPH